jgi:hypothetical protein
MKPRVRNLARLDAGSVVRSAVVRGDAHEGHMAEGTTPELP